MVTRKALGYSFAALLVLGIVVFLLYWFVFRKKPVSTDVKATAAAPIVDVSKGDSIENSPDAKAAGTKTTLLEKLIPKAKPAPTPTTEASSFFDYYF